MKFLTQLTAGAICVAALIAPAQAGIVSGAVTGGDSGGGFVELDPSMNDFSIGPNTFDTGDLFVFEEGTFVVANSLELDIGALAVGQSVTSHLIAFDPATAQSIEATLQFAGDILGVATSSANIEATSAFQNAFITYIAADNIGLEATDVVMLSAANELTIALTAIAPIDVIRVFTVADDISAVPLPAAFWFFLLGASGLGLGFRRRRS